MEPLVSILIPAYNAEKWIGDAIAPAEWLIRKMGSGAHMQTATWLVSRELTVAAGRWDTRLLGDDDGEYFCRVLLHATGIIFISMARSYYRSLGGNQLSEIGRSN